MPSLLLRMKDMRRWIACLAVVLLCMQPAMADEGMNQAAAELNFELAAQLRDELKEFKIAYQEYDD